MPLPSESEIHGLKSQEAKDLCIELINKLKSKQGEPISPGEVQLQELQYELRLKEAEAEDQRKRESSQLRIKEFELEIEQEKSAQIHESKLAEDVQQRYAQVIEQVGNSQEKMSAQFERASREHEVKLQMMQSAHDDESQKLKHELAGLEDQRVGLLEEIKQLSGLKASADDVETLQTDIEEQLSTAEKKQKQLAEEWETTSFEKQKELTDLRRKHDLDLAELRASHRKMLLETNLDAVDQLLSQTEFQKIYPEELARLQTRAKQHQAQSEEEAEAIRQAAVNEFRKQYNLNTTETLDVTELYYRSRALQEENELSEKQIAKLETEIARMRSHIEKESSRVAIAVEAARTSIQNTIEPGVKR